MFKKGQLVKTKHGGQYVIVTQDEKDYSVSVDVWGLVRKKHGYAFRDNLTLIGNNFKFKGGEVMEELICIESGPDVQGWFVKGNKYSSGVYYDCRKYVLDEDGDEWDLEDSAGGTLTVSFSACLGQALFTTASNHDASADDSEGGCRE